MGPVASSGVFCTPNSLDVGSFNAGIIQRVVVPLSREVKFVHHGGRNHFGVGDVAKIVVELVVPWKAGNIRRATLHEWIVVRIVESNQGDGETMAEVMLKSVLIVNSSRLSKAGPFGVKVPWGWWELGRAKYKPATPD